MAKRSSTVAKINEPKPLTRREHEIGKCLVSGMTNAQIAKLLDISIKTVDTHRGHTLKKLGLANNVELVRFWIAMGWPSRDNENVALRVASYLAAFPEEADAEYAIRQQPGDA